MSKWLYAVLLFAALFCSNVFAWKHGISVGFGCSQAVGFNYYNYGSFVDAKLYKFKKLDKTLIVGIDGAWGHWYDNYKTDKRLDTFALSLAFRAYFAPPEQHKISPYLLATFGPSYLSSRKFGKNEQGKNISFQTTLGGGSEFAVGKQAFDVNVRLVHYCNAGIFPPNGGINILYLLSVGYLF